VEFKNLKDAFNTGLKRIERSFNSKKASKNDALDPFNRSFFSKFSQGGSTKITNPLSG